MKIELVPIGFVTNDRAAIADDNWGQVVSAIELADHIIAEALEGIEAFSHLEVIFFMDKVENEKAIAQYRHPRNNPALPKVGTFAQRNKKRPNKIGLTIVEFVAREGKVLKVRRLDAVDGTPVLDIKPVMREFLPYGTVRQPNWTSEIMKNYWDRVE